MTEIRVLDTYWSDHCRHTTFSTELKDVTFEDGDYKAADWRRHTDSILQTTVRFSKAEKINLSA